MLVASVVSAAACSPSTTHAPAYGGPPTPEPVPTAAPSTSASAAPTTSAVAPPPSASAPEPPPPSVISLYGAPPVPGKK